MPPPHVSWQQLGSGPDIGAYLCAKKVVYPIWVMLLAALNFTTSHLKHLWPQREESAREISLNLNLNRKQIQGK